ncbi:RNAse Z [Thermoactinomyces sp. DSM 45891]|uniref:ribonuclease Z n=1 Tax=Thermoactinomyces sp. DSM 45891 TaxID=1761907 RepID=UPI00091C8940|nr:ribonuclease Z [Thermoactinomyces sp. DSM 45891]SFX58305.1 RNAse Z [Thermoactinomyces sp. DSM 45891]
MRVQFLGTGAGIPSKQRNVSSLAIQWYQHGGQTWLIDCGEATQHQILQHPVKLNKINQIFITHLHGDHIYGLPGLLGSRSFQGGKSPLRIYAPKGLQEWINVSLQISETHLHYPLEIIEIYEGMTWSDDSFHYVVRQLEHGVPSFGFRFEEKSQSGALQVHKLQQIGIQPGPLYQQLKKGKRIQLEDGTWLNGADYLSDPVQGLHMAVIGDTRFTSAIHELADGVDLLIHEATFRAEQEELAQNFFHSTSTQAAAIAKLANVKQLILNHISSRYQPDEIEQLLAEAQAVFPQTLIAHDGFAFEWDQKRIQK